MLAYDVKKQRFVINLYTNIKILDNKAPSFNFKQHDDLA